MLSFIMDTIVMWILMETSIDEEYSKDMKAANKLTEELVDKKVNLEYAVADREEDKSNKNAATVTAVCRPVRPSQENPTSSETDPSWKPQTAAVGKGVSLTSGLIADSIVSSRTSNSEGCGYSRYHLAPVALIAPTH